MPASESGVLALPAQLTTDHVPAHWPALSRAAAQADTLDLAAVEALDSAGLALLRVLCAGIAAAGRPPRLVHVPARYHQLLAAHRLAAEDPAR